MNTPTKRTPPTEQPTMIPISAGVNPGSGVVVSEVFNVLSESLDEVSVVLVPVSMLLLSVVHGKEESDVPSEPLELSVLELSAVHVDEKSDEPSELIELAVAIVFSVLLVIFKVDEIVLVVVVGVVVSVAGVVLNDVVLVLPVVVVTSVALVVGVPSVDTVNVVEPSLLLLIVESSVLLVIVEDGSKIDCKIRIYNYA